MHTKIRTSALKHRRQVSFHRRKKTKGGREITNNQRRVAAGGPKRIKKVKARHCKARRVAKGKSAKCWRR